MSERPKRIPGFRLSIVDVIFLLSGGAAVLLLRERLGVWVWSIPVAMGHFFLFCNVFRVRRAYELTWVAIFFVNVAAWVAADRFSWLAVLAVQTPVTIAAIGMEMRSPRYHGIGCRRINAAHLEEWINS